MSDAEKWKQLLAALKPSSSLKYKKTVADFCSFMKYSEEVLYSSSEMCGHVLKYITNLKDTGCFKCCRYL